MVRQNHWLARQPARTLIWSRSMRPGSAHPSGCAAVQATASAAPACRSRPPPSSPHPAAPLAGESSAWPRGPVAPCHSSLPHHRLTSESFRAYLRRPRAVSRPHMVGAACLGPLICLRPRAWHRDEKADGDAWWMMHPLRLRTSDSLVTGSGTHCACAAGVRCAVCGVHTVSSVR